MNRIDKINNIQNNLNSLRHINSSVKNSLQVKSREQKILFKNVNEDLDEEAWDQYRGDVEKLEDNSNQILQIMERQNETIRDTFTITGEILNLLKTKEGLSCYRDWITSFIKKIKVKLGLETWVQISNAFDSKIRLEKSDFSENYRRYITQLENILKDDQITITEFELLMRIKMRGNAECHNSGQTLIQAKEQLKSLPNEMKDFEKPLNKLLNALEKYWSAV